MLDRKTRKGVGGRTRTIALAILDARSRSSDVRSDRWSGPLSSSSAIRPATATSTAKREESSDVSRSSPRYESDGVGDNSLRAMYSFFEIESWSMPGIWEVIDSLDPLGIKELWRASRNSAQISPAHQSLFEGEATHILCRGTLPSVSFAINARPASM